MVALPHAFNVDDVPMDDEPLPDDDYMAHIIESKLKDTKKQGGKFIELTFEVMDGIFAKRRVWERYNIVNENAKAVEIAYRDLAKLAKACGHAALHDTSDLHGIPLLIRVRTDTSGQRPQNVISAYLPASGEAAEAPPSRAHAPPPTPRPAPPPQPARTSAPPPPPRTAPPPAGGGSAPWRQ